MIKVYKTEKTYYEQAFSRRQVIDMLVEVLPDEFTREHLSQLNEQRLADTLHSVLDCYEVSEYLEAEMAERDSGDDWEVAVESK